MKSYDCSKLSVIVSLKLCLLIISSMTMAEKQMSPGGIPNSKPETLKILERIQKGYEQHSNMAGSSFCFPLVQVSFLNL